MMKRIPSYYETGRSKGNASALETHLSKELEENLRALGYIQ